MSTQWKQLYQEAESELSALKLEKAAHRKLLRAIGKWMDEHGFEDSLREAIKEILKVGGRPAKKNG